MIPPPTCCEHYYCCICHVLCVVNSFVCLNLSSSFPTNSIAPPFPTFKFRLILVPIIFVPLPSPSLREMKAQREDKEALQLGQDFDRKALPRPSNPRKEKENATPPLQVGAEPGQQLSKAQLKRRRKKAALMKSETGGDNQQEKKAGQTNLEADVGGASTTKPLPHEHASSSATAEEGGAAKLTTDPMLPWVAEPSQHLLSEQQRMEDVLVDALYSNPDNRNLSESQTAEPIKNLVALTYPLVVDLLDSVNNLSRPLEDFDPGPPKSVSVMVDPFSIYKGHTTPTTGAIAFVKRKNKVRGPAPRGEKKKDTGPPPPLPADLDARALSASTILPPSMRLADEVDGSSRLAKLMVEAVRTGVQNDDGSEDEPKLDYSFVSLPSSRLPRRLRALVESNERDGEMHPLMIDIQEFRDALVNTKRYGVVSPDGRHQDTESVVFFPSRLEYSGARDMAKVRVEGGGGGVASMGSREAWHSVVKSSLKNYWWF